MFEDDRARSISLVNRRDAQEVSLSFLLGRENCVQIFIDFGKKMEKEKMLMMQMCSLHFPLAHSGISISCGALVAHSAARRLPLGGIGGWARKQIFFEPKCMKTMNATFSEDTLFSRSRSAGTEIFESPPNL